jgi:hypothetical protein
MLHSKKREEEGEKSPKDQEGKRTGIYRLEGSNTPLSLATPGTLRFLKPYGFFSFHSERR